MPPWMALAPLSVPALFFVSSLSVFAQEFRPAAAPESVFRQVAHTIAQPVDAERPVPPAPAAEQPTEDVIDAERRQIDPSRHFGQEVTPVLPPITYLRNEAVLLKRGEYMVDVGAVYAINEYEVPLIVAPDSATVGRVTDRTLYSPFAFRYGLTDSLQAQVFVPVGYTAEQFDVVPAATFTDAGRPAGDTTVSLNYSLPSSMTGECTVVWTNALLVPTGHPHSLFDVPDAPFGSGYFQYGSSVLAIRRYDPLLVFGGFGIRYGFATEISGQSVERGFCGDYQFGVGFGVNETMSLSAKLFGSYEPALQVNGNKFAGSQRDLISLRFAVTKANECRIVEPFVTVGCTPAANDVQLGVVWTFR